MNRKHDYPALEREYIAGDMSIRELARRHGIFNASLVHVQARKGDWVTKRAEYRRRAQHKTMERLADGDARRAARELEVRDHAIEVVDQALTRLSEDMSATHVIEKDGRQTVEPLVRVTPKDVALLWIGSPSCSTGQHLPATAASPGSASMPAQRSRSTSRRSGAWARSPVSDLVAPDPSRCSTVLRVARTSSVQCR
jgi:hypothetical protein